MTTEKLDCGHVPTPTPHTTGVAETPSGFRMCYPCSERWERSAMANANEYFGYISSDGKHLTTWTGGKLARVVTETNSRTGFHRSEIHNYRFVDDAGVRWYGKNAGRGMSIRVRRYSTQYGA
jgi:hypothetical protein